MKNILRMIIDWLFPQKCLGCGKEGSFLCDACFVQIVTKRFQVCPVCKKTSYQGRVHKEKCARKTHLDGLMVAASYHENPFLEKAIKQFKYKYSTDLGDKLSLLMVKVLRENHMTGREWVLVPIPLHKKREAWRGFNQADILACGIARYTSQIVFPILWRKKHTKQQARLTRAERIKNMKDAFDILQPVGLTQPDGLKIVIIDDVSSTLSTLEEAAKVLKKNGMREVFGLVLARG